MFSIHSSLMCGALSKYRGNACCRTGCRVTLPSDHHVTILDLYCVLNLGYFYIINLPGNDRCSWRLFQEPSLSTEDIALLQSYQSILLTNLLWVLQVVQVL